MRLRCLVALCFVLATPGLAAMQKVNMPQDTPYQLVKTKSSDEKTCTPYFRLYAVGVKMFVSVNYFVPGFAQARSLEVDGAKLRFIQTDNDSEKPVLYLEGGTGLYVIRAPKNVIMDGMKCSEITPIYTEETRSSN